MIDDHDEEQVRHVALVHLIVCSSVILDYPLHCFLELVRVTNSWNWVLDDLPGVHAHLLLAVQEVTRCLRNNILSNLLLIVEHDQSCSLQLISIENGHFFQKWLVDEKAHVISFFVNQLWRCKSPTLDDLRLLLNGDVPFLPLAHLQEFVDHVCYLLKLISGRLLDSIEELPHLLSAVSNLLWHSILQAKLGRNLDVPSMRVDDKHWLLFCSDS